MNSIQRAATGAVMIVLAAAGIVASPVSAQAATCKASSCEGKDPNSYGCSSGARNLASFADNGVTFELRYSEKCMATWTRTTSTRDYNTLFGQVRSYDFTTKARKKVYGVQVQKGTRWTKMVSFSGQWVKGCDSWVWFDADPDHCTDYK